MDDTHRTLCRDITERFQRIIIKGSEMVRKPWDPGVGYPLHSAEVLTIVAIADYPGLNITELALKNGVTKGAVSKLVKKLVQKNLVNKEKALNNDKEISLRLTHRGWFVYERQMQHHEQLFNEFEGLLAHFSREQVDSFLTLLDIVDHHIDRHLER
jgi:DNA-binding MarR family transcriptional regulator